MIKPEPSSADSYFDAARSWAADRQQEERRSQRLAWRIAAAACLVAVLEALALLALTPLKSVEPLTLLVDRQTGFVQALSPLNPQTIGSDAALTQSFLVQYVIAREGFNYASLQTDYRKVGLWSSGSARTQYLASMQASNPQSPLATYPRSTIVDVQVKSVTPLSRTSALVRYDTARIEADARRQPPRSWASVIRFTFTRAPLSVADRYVNPLGFQVTNFHRSQEAIGRDNPAVATLAPASVTAISLQSRGAQSVRGTVP